jgi:ribosomal RNA assembly protein
MVRTLNIEKKSKIKKIIPILEDKIKIKFILNNNNIKIKGTELNEFLTEQIVLAIDFGFDLDDALLLLRQNYLLKFIDLKEHTKRHNLKDVRARVIGRNGKAKKTIEYLTGSIIIIKDNTIGLIVDDIHLDTTTQAIISLIQGSKHSNIFSYLEKQNKNIIEDDDLGIKENFEKYSPEEL